MGRTQTLIGIADAPTDDDDLRLRKRVGVIAAYVLIVLSIQLSLLAGGLPLSWAVAVALPAVNAANLFVLARTKRFERYVVVLAASILVAAMTVEVALGGLNGSSAAIVFGYLAPVLALLGLGPRRATAWFVGFVGILVASIVLDPVLSSQIEPQPYPRRLAFYAANLLVPLGVTFALLRYTDLRRRAAEARPASRPGPATPTRIASSPSSTTSSARTTRPRRTGSPGPCSRLSRPGGRRAACRLGSGWASRAGRWSMA